MNRKIIILIITLIIMNIMLLMPSAAEPITLRVTTWGGNYRDVYAMAVDKFEKENNCKIEWVIGQNPEFIVKARNNQVDVVTVNYKFALQGEEEGLWLKLDPEIITNMKDLHKRAIRSDYILWKDIGESFLLYNSNYIKEEPTSWLDLWKPEYKDRVILLYFLNAGTLELTALLAELEGGSIDNMEPGIRKLAELYNSGNLHAMPESETVRVQLYEQEEVWIGQMSAGRIKDLWDKGFDQLKIVRPVEGTFSFQSSISIAKNTPYPELAQKFVNYAISPENQTNFILYNLYAPTNMKVTIPDFEYKDLILTPEDIDTLFIPDYVTMNKYQGEWAEMFDRLTIE